MTEKAGCEIAADAPPACATSGRDGRLDPDVEHWFGAARAAFPRSRSSLIPMLHSAQTRLGYLPADAMVAIARHVMASPALVEGVASFYSQFRFSKPGRHRFTVCTGTACYVRGGGQLLDEVQRHLGISSGETTGDGFVSLEAVSCFGACALAPVVVLDDEVLRQQTGEKMKKVLKQIASGPSTDRARDDSASADPSAVAR
jgi:NADH:ubiquinone oxidoreductase subunit E